MLNVNFTLSSRIHVVVPINFIELFFNKVGKKKKKEKINLWSLMNDM